MLTGGLENQIEGTLNDGSAQITVMAANSTGMETSNNLDGNLTDDLKNITGVKDAASIMVASESSSSTQMGGGPSSTTSSIRGIEPDKIDMVGITNVNGSVYTNNTTEVVIGKTLAENQNKTIGDTITLLDTDFEVVGIYETGSIFSDGNMYTSLATVENLTNSSNISQVAVRTAEDVNVSEVNNNIIDAYTDNSTDDDSDNDTNQTSNITTITSDEKISQMDTIMNTLNVATYAISALAIIIGSVGIINTMVTTVYERTREIGVLKAVGWTNKRVLTMILGESLVLTIVSAIIGTVVGVVVAEIGISLIATDVFSLAYNPSTFILAFGVAIVVGIIGGLYPAYHASKLAPTEALRYE